MKKLQFIHKILPYVDDAFQEFYDAMLSDPKLSIFFDNDEQIQRLLQMQKAHFLKTLDMPASELKASYVKLGEYHYDIRIPYVDFIKGSEMLKEYFLLHSVKEELSREIMDDIFDYFKFMKSFTAKGYLNRMITEDKKDIENFFMHSQDDEKSNLSNSIAHDKITWLKNLLHLIESGGDLDIDVTEGSLDKWLHEVNNLSIEKREFVDDLEKRIILNTQNLFYFLKKEDYLEILPLYSSLLSIYKLTLLLNNVLTYEYANSVIASLKMDPLSGLLRHESLIEFLNKEINYAKRDENHIFSIAYLDLDNFKQVNDNFGHYSGDNVIQKFGEIIRSSIRGSDIAFRIGGDEFAIIFKDATKLEAKKACQKIKAEFSSHEFIFNDSRVFNVSASIGIVQYDKKLMENLESMIKLVDEKLYSAKHDGRNQIAY